jgi:hypothetical protein
VGVAPDIVACTLQLESMQVYASIDPRANHSFITYRIVDKLHVLPSKLNMGVTVGTPLGECIDIDNVYRGVKLYIEGL